MSDQDGVLVGHMSFQEQPAKTSVSPHSSPPGTFREEERLRLSSRNSILMTHTNVYIINPVVMGFQIQICPILSVFWSILVECCVHLPTSSSKTQILLLEKTIFPQTLTVLLEIFRVYISPLWPFVFCLSFVNNS